MLKGTSSDFEGLQNVFQKSYTVSKWTKTCAEHSKNWFIDHTQNGEDFLSYGAKIIKYSNWFTWPFLACKGS